jgi:sigma-B regulation protein RsbU (phosphoserine phosphatase)
MPTRESERMQCMEVWGGNQQVDRELQTTGLDVWMYSQPHANSQSGGDVYYVSSCASGRITRILLADVSGHGDAVADRAEDLRQLMRRNINRIDQSSLVNSINQEFAAASTDWAFATALIGTFFAPTQTLTLSNAGHPSPLVYQPKKNAWRQLRPIDLEQSDECNFPLGIETDQNYSGVRTKLRPGDLVLCFTDGLIELERPNGKMLGFDGLLEIVSQLDPHEPSQLIKQLVEKAASTNHSINSGDDVSIVLFQLNDERVSLRDNLLAPFRVAASILDHRRKGAAEK